MPIKVNDTAEAVTKAGPQQAAEKVPELKKADGPLRLHRATSQPEPPPNSQRLTHDLFGKADPGMGVPHRARSIAALQRSVGNARLARAIGSRIQTKLTVGRPSDASEREADRVAETVTQQGLRPLARTRSSLAQRQQDTSTTQRDLFGSGLTNREQINKAIKSQDPDDVKNIKNVNEATEAEKLALIRILAYQNWVANSDEYKIEEIWASFGDKLPRVMSEHSVLWNYCMKVGADLDDLPLVKKIRARFKHDVLFLALGYLKKNYEYVKEEMTRLGLGEKSPSPEQDKRLKEMQHMTRLVKQAREVEWKLRQIKVGERWRTTQPVMPYQTSITTLGPQYFDPESHPDVNRSGDSKDYDRDWREVKELWDRADAFIRKVAIQYPAIYAAIQQSDIYEGGTDKVADIVGEKDPAQARAVIGEIMNELLDNIKVSVVKIGTGDADYHKFTPLHAQLFGKSVASPTSTDWSDPFNRWVADDDLATQKKRDFWIDLGLKTAAMAAFVVVEFASFGTATVAFFTAAGIGLSATGYQAYTSVEQYMTLEQLSKSNVKDKTAIVDPATVAAEGEKAIKDVASFIMMSSSVGTKLLGGLGKPPQSGGGRKYPSSDLPEEVNISQVEKAFKDPAELSKLTVAERKAAADFYRKKGLQAEQKHITEAGKKHTTRDHLELGSQQRAYNEARAKYLEEGSSVPMPKFPEWKKQNFPKP